MRRGGSILSCPSHELSSIKKQRSLLIMWLISDITGNRPPDRSQAGCWVADCCMAAYKTLCACFTCVQEQEVQPEERSFDCLRDRRKCSDWTKCSKGTGTEQVCGDWLVKINWRRVQETPTWPISQSLMTHQFLGSKWQHNPPVFFCCTFICLSSTCRPIVVHLYLTVIHLLFLSVCRPPVVHLLSTFICLSSTCCVLSLDHLSESQTIERTVETC